jgi:16S rRNA (cytidine1402-2'-O)-methyltransferase
VAREISKLYEEFSTASLAELKADYASRGKVKGEIVVIVAGV